MKEYYRNLIRTTEGLGAMAALVFGLVACGDSDTSAPQVIQVEVTRVVTEEVVVEK